MSETVLPVDHLVPPANMSKQIGFDHVPESEESNMQTNEKIKNMENLKKNSLSSKSQTVLFISNPVSNPVFFMSTAESEPKKDIKANNPNKSKQKRQQFNKFTGNKICDQNIEQKEQPLNFLQFVLNEEDLKNVNTAKTNDQTHGGTNQLCVTFAENDDLDSNLPYFHTDFIFEDHPQTDKNNQNQVNRTSSVQSIITKFINAHNAKIDAPKKKPKLPESIKLQSGVDSSKKMKIEGESPSTNGKIMEIEARVKVDKQQWRYFILKIADSSISIGDVSIKANLISKIKVYSSGQSFAKCNTLKITLKGSEKQQIFLALQKFSKWADLPLPYVTFAKLIIKKLKNVGIRNVTVWDLPEKKPKKYQIGNNGPQTQQNKKSEASNQKKVKAESSKSKQHSKLSKTSTLYKHDNSYVYIHGSIFKKSQFLGKWSKRYTIINDFGILSYRHQTDEQPSIRIEKESIKYMWTWLNILVAEADVEEQMQQKMKQYTEKEIMSLLQKQKEKRESNLFLVVKIKYNFNDQTQFAIPICNFDIATAKNKNWLLAFYRILPQLKEQY